MKKSDIILHMAIIMFCLTCAVLFLFTFQSWVDALRGAACFACIATAMIYALAL